MTIILLMGAAFIAGAMNSVAGGGSFLTFPALVFYGLPSVTANTTNTVAVFPASLASAWAYRKDFPQLEGIKTSLIVTISAIGGILGAILLVSTPEHTFNKLLPWLLLAATSLFAFSKQFVHYVRNRYRIGPFALCSIQFLIAVYGGYFGGAMGIMMLALFALFGIDNIHSANALKTLIAGVLNAVSALCFIIIGKVDWPLALIMMSFSVIGGYLGARIARKMQSNHIRFVVISIGLTMTIIFFCRS